MEGVVSEWVELLQQNLDGVPKKDLEFATSLLNQAKKRQVTADR